MLGAFAVIRGLEIDTNGICITTEGAKHSIFGVISTAVVRIGALAAAIFFFIAFITLTMKAIRRRSLVHALTPSHLLTVLTRVVRTLTSVAFQTSTILEHKAGNALARITSGGLRVWDADASPAILATTQDCTLVLLAAVDLDTSMCILIEEACWAATHVFTRQQIDTRGSRGRARLRGTCTDRSALAIHKHM